MVTTRSTYMVMIGFNQRLSLLVATDGILNIVTNNRI